MRRVKELGNMCREAFPTKGREGFSGQSYIFAVLNKGGHHG